MSLKFCANLNFMFGENGVNLLEKYRRAHKAGFHGVETGFPTGFSLEDVKKVYKRKIIFFVALFIFSIFWFNTQFVYSTQVQNETGMEQVLLNICLGKFFFLFL